MTPAAISAYSLVVMALDKTVLGGLMVVLAAGGSGAFAQGAAEAALTHALSTAAGASAGTSLGRVTNQLATKTGQQVSRTVIKPGGNRTNRPVRTPPARPQTASLGSTPGGPLISSIQGGEPDGPPCRAVVALKPGEEARAAKTACSAQVADQQNAHPAVITLPAPH